ILHPIHWFCFSFFGYDAHKKSVHLASFLSLFYLRFFLASKFDITGTIKIPNDTPLIFVSTHQSIWENPAMDWFLGKYHPKFTSKKSLKWGYPSISYNLRKGGSVLIDRKDRKQAT